MQNHPGDPDNKPEKTLMNAIAWEITQTLLMIRHWNTQPTQPPQMSVKVDRVWKFMEMKNG